MVVLRRAEQDQALNVRAKKAEIQGREVDGSWSRVWRVTRKDVKGESRPGEERQPCVLGTGTAEMPWCLHLRFSR